MNTALDRRAKNESTRSTSEHPRVEEPQAGQQQHQDAVGGDEVGGLVVRHGGVRGSLHFASGHKELSGHLECRPAAVRLRDATPPSHAEYSHIYKYEHKYIPTSDC